LELFTISCGKEETLFPACSSSFSPLETYLNFPRTPTGLFEFVSFGNLTFGSFKFNQKKY